MHYNIIILQVYDRAINYQLIASKVYQLHPNQRLTSQNKNKLISAHYVCNTGIINVTDLSNKLIAFSIVFFIIN